MPLSGDVIHVCLFVYFLTDERVIIGQNEQLIREAVVYKWNVKRNT